MLSLVVTNSVLSFPTGYHVWDLGLHFVSSWDDYALEVRAYSLRIVHPSVGTSNFYLMKFVTLLKGDKENCRMQET